MEAFYPAFHEQIDFEKVTFLSEEMFTGVYSGNKRILDLAVEVKWKETDSLIVIHIEPQSYEQKDFNDRMFKYFSLLYNKIEKPILPIAIFSYEAEWEKDKFKINFSDHNVLRINYLTLHLRKQNWRKFIKKNNPVAAAFLSKMGYSNGERIQVKLEFLKIIAGLKLDREKSSLLIGFFETYLQLNEEEEETLMKEAKELENAKEILELPISYEERGKEKGKEIGRSEQKRDIALKMLQKDMDIELIQEITKLTKEEIVGLKELI